MLYSSYNYVWDIMKTIRIRKHKQLYSLLVDGGIIQISSQINLSTNKNTILTTYKLSSRYHYELKNLDSMRRARIRARDNYQSPTLNGFENHHLWYSEDYDPESFITVTQEQHILLHRGDLCEVLY